MSEKKGWRDIHIGGVIEEAGGAEEYETGSWRTFRPIYDPEKCIQCLRCWAYCPDGAIVLRDGEVAGINYVHCKGCGICAHECPEKVRAITMKQESEFARSEGDQTKGRKE